MRLKCEQLKNEMERGTGVRAAFDDDLRALDGELSEQLLAREGVGGRFVARNRRMIAHARRSKRR